MTSAPPSTDQIPPLTLLASLPHPSGTTRTWQSSPHPSQAHPLLATASADKSVNVWSLRDFRLLSTITGGHKRSVRCVGWKDYGSKFAKRRKIGPDHPSSLDEDDDDLPNTKKDPVVLATGSFDANVGIWVHNENYGKSTPAGHASQLDDDDPIDMTDGERGDDGDDEEWHFSTLLTGPDSEIKSVAFGPPHYGANLLATSSRDKSVWVWEEVEEDEWETIAVLQEHTGDVKCVAWCGGAKAKRSQNHSDPNTDVDGDEEEEEKIVGSRELLASGSYDDTVRLWRDVEEEGDWTCVGVIDGHAGTVWSVSWERHVPSHLSSDRKWEPRLASCSDDLTVRIWRRHVSVAEREREERNRSAAGGGRRLPSIIRPASSMETWEADAVLPEVHLRSVYAVDWSARTGLIVSCGGDGTVAVYREEQREERDTDKEGDVVMDMNGAGEGGSHGDGEEEGEEQTQGTLRQRQSTWKVAAIMEAAHDEFEINHVCWALRRDPGKRFEGEEVIVSTGDDGVVRIWALPEGIV